MAHEAIGTAVMVMTTVIITVALMNAIFPSILGSASSIESTGAEADDRAATSLAFINYEVVSQTEIRFDVMNNGRTAVPESAIQIMTVYLGGENTPLLLLSSNSSGTQTYWTYVLTGADESWDRGETMVLQVSDPAGGFTEGNYRLRFHLSNGAMSEQAFTV